MAASEVERKIAIMGYRSVGKSSLTIQLVQNQFVVSYDPTIENTFTKTCKFRGKNIQLRIVDTAGQDEHSLFPRNLSVDIHGYVLVYAINSRKSFDIIHVIHEKIQDMTGKTEFPLVVVGNKLDLHHEREVSKAEGQQLAAQWKAAFLEVSAKEHPQVCEVFDRILLEVEKSFGNVKSGDDSKGNCSIS